MTMYRNLIFDLGDVIIDIDYAITVAEFQKLAKVDFSEIVSYSRQHHVFDRLEKGQISEADFWAEIKLLMKPDVTNEELVNAWNSILINYPKYKIELLQNLRSRYQVFALSNINEIHIREIDRVAKEQFGAQRFADFFHKAYYSNETGYRKPESEIYELVLKSEQLNPSETFFVDDKAENVEAARNLGIQAYQLTNRDKLVDLLQEHKIL